MTIAKKNTNKTSTVSKGDSGGSSRDTTVRAGSNGITGNTTPKDEATTDVADAAVTSPAAAVS